MINFTADFPTPTGRARGRIVGRETDVTGAEYCQILWGHVACHVKIADVVPVVKPGYQVVYLDYRQYHAVGEVVEAYDDRTILVKNGLDKRNVLVEYARLLFLLRGGDRA